jgi:peptidoglycan/LPS O-acetylase OafA/YrhL
MGMKRHIAICLLSVGLAYGFFAIAGGWQPAAKLLHRWSVGVFVVFALLFTIALFLSLRGRVSRSLWVIPISAILAYLVSIFAYFSYFAFFEPERLLNTLSHTRMLDVGMLLLVGPAFSLVWFFGAVAGAVSFFLASALGD